MTDLGRAGAADFAELTPLVRRAASLDPAVLVRLRIEPGEVTALARLPFGVLVGRRITGPFTHGSDRVYRADELVSWLDHPAGDPPPARDGDWRTGVPPRDGWQRVETVPDDVIRGLVRTGAMTLKDAARREGAPDAQPRAEVADALLDSTVITAEQGAYRVEVSLRPLSALVRMGFLARDSHLGIDLAGRWLRLAATYGSAYAERPGLGLGVSPRR